MDNVIHFKDWKNSYIPNILDELYLKDIYKPYLKYIKDQIVIDAGMNIGLWSMFASPYAAQVYGFEPAKETYQIALKNITDNKLHNVKAYQKAISEENGKQHFYHNENTTMNSLNDWVGNKPELTEEVETIRLDTFVKEEEIEHIGFLKYDCEGVEHLFFNSEAFRNIAPITDAIVYEWHNWCAVPAQNINDAIREAGFTNIKKLDCDALVFGCTK